MDMLTSKKAYTDHNGVRKNYAGRNNSGKIVVRHRGGGVKQKLRQIAKPKEVTNGLVLGLEYDPTRTAPIACLKTANGIKYIPASEDMQLLEPCKVVPIHTVPVGTKVSNVEIAANQGSKYAKSAGTSCIVIGFSNNLARIQLPSGEQRYISRDAYVTLGSIRESVKVPLRKAGQSRLRGVRPTVRGVAMNPVDHPHGGGEGKTSGGRPSVTPWGKITKGKPTRRFTKAIRITK